MTKVNEGLINWIPIYAEIDQTFYEKFSEELISHSNEIKKCFSKIEIVEKNEILWVKTTRAIFDEFVSISAKRSIEEDDSLMAYIRKFYFDEVNVKKAEQEDSEEEDSDQDEFE